LCVAVREEPPVAGQVLENYCCHAGGLSQSSYYEHSHNALVKRRGSGGGCQGNIESACNINLVKTLYLIAVVIKKRPRPATVYY
jgi:hypothetical protein